MEAPRETLDYATAPPVQPRRTGRAVAHLIGGMLLLGVGLLIVMPMAIGVAFLEQRSDETDWFAVTGAASLTMLAVGLILSGVGNFVSAVQWLRGVDPSHGRLSRWWRRINTFGRGT